MHRRRCRRQTLGFGFGLLCDGVGGLVLGLVLLRSLMILARRNLRGARVGGPLRLGLLVWFYFVSFYGVELCEAYGAAFADEGHFFVFCILFWWDNGLNGGRIDLSRYRVIRY